MSMESYSPVSEFNRALLSLEGLLWGIVADDIINRKELEKLKNWKNEHYETIKHHPVGGLIQLLDSVADFHILQKREKAFMQDFCRQYGQCDEEEDPLSCDRIRMEGFIQGILADKKIYEGEIRSFYQWLTERPHLTELQEYPEIVDKLDQYLDDRQISSNEMYQFLESVV